MDDNKNNNGIISTGDWLVTKILILIPVVNIILLIIWSLSKSENQNKVNWARATLFIYLIRVCFALIIILIFFSFFITLFNF
tara:strand:+ start:1221 stop:1466 length:246 start_codon:yes stop_codon:yes gene_type:complete